jgi:hypothetical protein
MRNAGAYFAGGVCFFALTFLTACASFKHQDQDTASASNAPSTNLCENGYALLYDLLGDEKDVSKLLIIKRERPELKTLIKEISQKSGEDHKHIGEFGKTNSQVNLKAKALPPAELETRKAISKAKTKELLTEKGKDFELQLLLSQNEALVYGTHLAGTTAKSESDPTRAQFLQQLSGELGQLRQKVLTMLMEHYSWSPPK